MTPLRLYKAQRVVPNDPPIDGVTIYIEDEMPQDVPFDAGMSAARFDEQAFALHYALKRTLPQGTMFRLAARLIEQVAGVVRVSSDVLAPERFEAPHAPGGETAECSPAKKPVRAVRGTMKNGSLQVDEVLYEEGGDLFNAATGKYTLHLVSAAREDREPMPGDVLGLYHEGGSVYAVRPPR